MDSIIGNFAPQFRFTSQERCASSVTVNTTPVPIISFRRKSDFRDRSVKLSGIEGWCSTGTIILEVYIDASLSGASWATPTNATAAETAVEADVSATSMTGGILIAKTLLKSGDANKAGQFSSREYNLDLPENANITLAARSCDELGADVDAALLTVREEW